MIQPVSLSTSLSISSIIQTRNSAHRISLPVIKSQYLYARFKHIWSYPADQTGEGVSISKLRVLDALIERLVKLKGEKIQSRSAEELDSSKVENLISTIQQELHSIAAGPACRYGSSFLESGLVVNILA